MGHYNDARRYNDSLLEKEPRNMQALSLKALIDDRVAKGIHSSVRSLIYRGVCWDGYCWKCGYWVYCCCDNVGEATVSMDGSCCMVDRDVRRKKYNGCIIGLVYSICVFNFNEVSQSK